MPEACTAHPTVWFCSLMLNRWPCPLSPLFSAVASLLQQLAGLSRTLSAAGFSSAVAVQFAAASATIRSCALLVERLPLQHSDIFRLASALAVVFEFGPVPLRYYTANLSAMDWRVLWIECHHQLAAASKVLQQAAHPEQQPEAAAAFVRTAGRPQAVLPWLAALGLALLALPTEPRRGGVGRGGDRAGQPAMRLIAVSRNGWVDSCSVCHPCIFMCVHAVRHAVHASKLSMA